MPDTTALYTPEVLSLATALADWPFDPTLPLQAESRSTACGSTVRLGLALDSDGRIARIGLGAQACAIGQAAAALFAKAATGRSADDVAAALSAIESWLGKGGALPDWPGFGAIERARHYPGRHGAILLAWRAARDALSTAPRCG